MSAEGGTRAVVAALTANLSIAVAKFVAWGLTGASSMLAEAIHSVADSGNQVLLLIGGRRGRQPADAEHPFGYGRVRYLYAFVVSIVLFSVGGLFALYEAYHKFEEVRTGHPNELLESQWWWVPLAVLGFAIIAESFSFRTALKEGNAARGRQSFPAFIRNSKSPELPVILLEDLAALIGLVLALFGVGLTLLTGNGIFDVIGTAMIGVLLVVVAAVLAWEMRSLLIGESASAEDIEAITEAITGTPGVDRLLNLRTLQLGPDDVLVAAKISVADATSADDVARVINAAEERIAAAEPTVTHCYLEPDIYAADYRPAPRPDGAEH
ncbi:cation diffusion facilitator family transporter [Naumannella cuiyingiana]|uniref:Cation diffusion facilitator family transporter n=1 Tax=Naumannella cuiyingiana TaxID=1347891 RepID=A0A7Z0D788_9ACTN|nr:cation diffusion facilitator family transporter [Naumannella cuiyingiana]